MHRSRHCEQPVPGINQFLTEDFVSIGYDPRKVTTISWVAQRRSPCPRRPTTSSLSTSVSHSWFTGRVSHRISLSINQFLAEDFVSIGYDSRNVYISWLRQWQSPGPRRPTTSSLFTSVAHSWFTGRVSHHLSPDPPPHPPPFHLSAPS